MWLLYASPVNSSYRMKSMRHALIAQLRLGIMEINVCAVHGWCSDVMISYDDEAANVVNADCMQQICEIIAISTWRDCIGQKKEKKTSCLQHFSELTTVPWCEILERPSLLINPNPWLWFILWSRGIHRRLITRLRPSRQAQADPHAIETSEGRSYGSKDTVKVWGGTADAHRR